MGKVSVIVAVLAAALILAGGMDADDHVRYSKYCADMVADGAWPKEVCK